MTPILFNTNENPAAITYNGQEVLKVYYNDDLVWEKIVTLYCSYSGTNTRGTIRASSTLIARTSSSGSQQGYCFMKFPPNERFNSFKKITLSLYCLGSGGNSIDLLIYPRSRSEGDSDTSYDGLSKYGYNVGLSHPYYTQSDTSTGWHEIDITEAIQELKSNDSTFLTTGLLILFRSYNNVLIAGYNHDNVPYLTIQ